MRLWDLFLALHAKLGTAPMLVLAIIGFYVLYEIKAKLGIDIFPHWGLHLPGPRTLFRQIAQAMEGH